MQKRLVTERAGRCSSIAEANRLTGARPSPPMQNLQARPPRHDLDRTGRIAQELGKPTSRGAAECCDRPQRYGGL